MGRTAPTYRQALEERLSRWDRFGRLLTTPEERAALDALRTSVRRYIPQATFGGSPDLTETIFLSILLDLSTRIGLGSTSALSEVSLTPDRRAPRARRSRRWPKAGSSISPKPATESPSSSG